MTNYPEVIHPIIKRFREDLKPIISCGEGWFNLLSSLDRELSSVDPDYKVVQVKEKFGTLRYYFDISDMSNNEVSEKMRNIVQKYEHISAMTCEITGGHGQLMSKKGWLRTLNRSFINEGWTPFE
jgi:hypothetical protein